MSNGDWRPPMAPGFVVAREGDACGLCEEPLHEGDEGAYVDDEACHASCAREDGFEVRAAS